MKIILGSIFSIFLYICGLNHTTNTYVCVLMGDYGCSKMAKIIEFEQQQWTTNEDSQFE